MANNITKSLFSEYIKDFKLRELFNYLGWDGDRTRFPPFKIGDTVFEPKIIADKNGFKIIEVRSAAVPLHPVRVQALKILKTKFDELMVIFTDNAKTRQSWLYPYKIGGQNKKAACEYRAGQDPQALYERAAGLFFSLDEEDNITIIDVSSRVRSNFTQNAERVTRRFYSEFKTEHNKLLGFIDGVTERLDREWYASIMLNRLMFCYFMQKRGFLNKDRHYLRNKLKESKERLGEGKFYSFYRSFLLTLFRDGFGATVHTPEIEAMLGKIPYLNGGLFDLHEIERRYPDIDISDDAFERIFTLFDKYEWHLDTRDCASGNEISPDVLGYIFEKYINDRSSMGAYYTQEDITGYISRSTILPYLLEAVKYAYPEPFASGGAVWEFLKESGGAYIFESVKRGADEPLPENIAAGLDTSAPGLSERRKDWNKPVPDGTAHLPTEIWREFIERTSRCRELIKKIEAGEIEDVSEFITRNLDIVNFTNDLLDTIEDPKFIRLFFEKLEKMTVLDPTCGSGAFLFAAMNILEPLYDACLSRMEDYISHDYKGSLGQKTRRYFEEKLTAMKADIHPNRKYFIFKSIILGNLYGVDIMKEAAETAKLRLFLKLVSTAEPDYQAHNLGIEPLPDIDFNIKSGNTLIGFANEEEVAAAYRLGDEAKRDDALEKMRGYSKATARYKQLQLGGGDYEAEDFKQAKEQLTLRQAELRNSLDALLKSNDYSNVPEEKWRENYAPFHWVSEFHAIITENKGFDVIIGNPPYVEYSKVRSQYTLDNYKTLPCGNLYAFVMERCTNIIADKGFTGMIVPMSITSIRAYNPLRENLKHKYSKQWLTNHSIRPVPLFADALQRVSIHLAQNSQNVPMVYTTKYLRHKTHFSYLFNNLSYQLVNGNAKCGITPKIGSEIDATVFCKVIEKKKQTVDFVNESPHKLYIKDYGETYWLFPLSFTPYLNFTKSYKSLSASSENTLKTLTAISNSNLFYWFYTAISDCWHFGNWHFSSFGIGAESLADDVKLQLTNFHDNLMISYVDHRTERYDKRVTGFLYEYYPKLSKPIIDEIDRILACHYGFTEEELDYIINYDIKYRMGLSGGDSGEGGDEGE